MRIVRASRWFNRRLGLTSQLSIAENIGLGALPRRYGLIDYRCLARRARAAMDLVGLDEDLATPVGDLPLGRRQMVEIAKALFREPRVLILDEPTSSLSAHEVETLTGLLDRLCAKGVAILYISHRLNEIMRLCQHVTVLKDGVVTADRSIEGVEAADLVRLMVGRDTGHLFPAWTPTAERDPIVSVSGLSAGVLRNIDISIRRGEVLGVGGLVGQGQEDLLLSLYGALPASALTADFNGRPTLPRRFARLTRWASPMCRLIANAKVFISFTASAGTSCCQASRAHLGCRCAIDRRARARQRARRPLHDQRRSHAASAGIVRRQPAESGAGEMDASRASSSVAERPDAGCGRRNKARNLRAAAPSGRRRQGDRSFKLRYARFVHLCDRVAVMREGRIVATIEREALSEEAIVAASMGANLMRTAA